MRLAKRAPSGKDKKDAAAVPGAADNMNAYLSFLVYLLAILGFVALTLWLNKVVGPKPVPTALKLEPFECGATPVEQVNVKAIPVKYYAIAIVFILFDLETVFLFLWALGAQPLTGALLAALGVFLVLLVFIMLYVWRTGLLEDVTR
jgi:NADH-quinone oxidoreductase subunit A